MIKAGQIWQYKREFCEERYLFLVKKLDKNQHGEEFWKVNELGENGGTNYLWISHDLPFLKLFSP